MNKSFVKFDATTNEQRMGDTIGNDYEKEILLQVFEKIKKINGGTSINKTAEILEDILLEKFKHQKSARTLVRYYNKYVLNKDELCGGLTLELNNFLAEILEHKDFNEFVESLKNNTQKIDSSFNAGEVLGKPSIKENKKTILELMAKKNTPYFVILILIGLGVINYLNSNYNITNHEKWMVWKIDHYEEFNNEIKPLNLNSIKLVPYNKKAIRKYRKIELKCEEPIKGVWYHKINNHEIELYNFPGLHPINEKTLKAMTYDMKKKYVCGKEIKNDN